MSQKGMVNDLGEGIYGTEAWKRMTRPKRRYTDILTSIASTVVITCFMVVLVIGTVALSRWLLS